MMRLHEALSPLTIDLSKIRSASPAGKAPILLRLRFRIGNQTAVAFDIAMPSVSNPSFGIGFLFWINQFGINCRGQKAKNFLHVPEPTINYFIGDDNP